MHYKNIKIVYEDNHILVVVKPQNMPTQLDSSNDPDLHSLLKEYLVEKYNKPGEAYLGLVHRLDRPTGGVMVFAKTSKAAARLTNSIQKMEFEKKYVCISIGQPPKNKDRLVNYLYKNEKLNKVTVEPIATEGVKRAELSYRVIAKNEKYSLMEVDLKSGRSHQIRVQLSHIGVPLYGDSKYGANENKDLIGTRYSLALWSYDLRFPHPTTKETMRFIIFPPYESMPWSTFNIRGLLNITKPSDF